ncbi:hypothetical protein B5S31_g2083 [[Candida] boidinii]|nr:hypothetical protein B5S31_g2083 [[Candida] boidinii]OWB77230.1 hypothetical protein B5S32_g1391 [[Candida] boidinii]
MSSDKFHYGIVIDSGSSGSRLQVYRWENPESLQKSVKDKKVARSIIKVVQESDWTYKTTPGLSSFANNPDDVWDDHFEPLIEYAEKIIPKTHHSTTPIFVQATAGMRLISESARNKILKKTCKSIKDKSKFYLPNCEEHIQVIDGETEGIYGWLALNYLKGTLNDYDSSLKGTEHESYGFMDMGGASTQIAFVPRDEESVIKHREDLYTLNLRNIDGSSQEWPIFVSTWLGFGANEARRRYLRSLVLSLPEGINYDTNGDDTYDLLDPCSPKGMIINYEHDGIKYEITGSGNYKNCLRGIYPLLLKNLPCTSEPCLFNGVHAPKIDFSNDKFVGVSEYWYTANDIFKMGGEYNFLQYEKSLKNFCETEWSKIENNFNNNQYGDNLKLSLLRDSCFKASWIVNVLHEGFELPRLGLDDTGLSEDKLKEDSYSVNKNHIPFQSANLIEGSEVAWTLGKILLVASSQIPALGNNKNDEVGIIPSAISLTKIAKHKVTSGASIPEYNVSMTGYWVLLLIMMILFGLFYLEYTKSLFSTKYSSLSNSLNSNNNNNNNNNNGNSNSFLFLIRKYFSKCKGLAVNTYYSKIASDDTVNRRQSEQMNTSMEEGRAISDSNSHSFKNLGTLRTRSSLNLQDVSYSDDSPTLTPTNSMGGINNNSNININGGSGIGIGGLGDQRYSTSSLPALAQSGAPFLGRKYNSYINFSALNAGGLNLGGGSGNDPKGMDKSS